MENDDLKKENLQLRHTVSNLKRKCDEIRSQRKSCAQCECLRKDSQALEAESRVVNADNDELRNDIEMLKILVYR